MGLLERVLCSGWGDIVESVRKERTPAPHLNRLFSPLTHYSWPVKKTAWPPLFALNVAEHLRN